MADRSPWWRSFVGKRRTAAREAAREAMLAQQQPQQTPAAKPSSPDTKPMDSPLSAAALPHASPCGQTPSLDSESQHHCPEKRNSSTEDLEPTFSEGTNRRNLRVSRSGRFKERKRVRVSLPQGDTEQTDKSPAKEDTSM